MKGHCMSALGQKQTCAAQKSDVRFVPVSDMAHETFLNTVQTTKAITIIATAKTIRKVLGSSAMGLALFAPVQCAYSGYSPRQLILACVARTVG